MGGELGVTADFDSGCLRDGSRSVLGTSGEQATVVAAQEHVRGGAGSVVAVIEPRLEAGAKDRMKWDLTGTPTSAHESVHEHRAQHQSKPTDR